jgi:hypothetical protein
MIKVVENKLVITRKKKPEKGDLMLCFATGIKDRKNGGYIGRKHYLSYHDDTNLARLNAICAGTEKVVFMISL